MLLKDRESLITSTRDHFEKCVKSLYSVFRVTYSIESYGVCRPLLPSYILARSFKEALDKAHEFTCEFEVEDVDGWLFITVIGIEQEDRVRGAVYA